MNPPPFLIPEESENGEQDKESEGIRFILAGRQRTRGP